MFVFVLSLYIRFLALNRGHKPFLALLVDHASYSCSLNRRSTHSALEWSLFKNQKSKGLL